MMKLFLCALVVAGASGAMTWKTCGTSADVCPASKVTITPDPPVAGQVRFNNKTTEYLFVWL